MVVEAERNRLKQELEGARNANIELLRIIGQLKGYQIETGSPEV